MSTVVLVIAAVMVGLTLGVLAAGVAGVVYLARIADQLQPESDTLEEKS